MSQITCVLTAFLGGRILSGRLADAVDRCAGPSTRLWFDDPTYHAYPAPFWLRPFSAFESEYVAWRWLRDQPPVRGPVVVNGYTLAIAGGWQQMIVATDVTPAMLARMSTGRTRRSIKHLVNFQFRRMLPRVCAWLPRSETVRRSLVEDYGVPEERCFVTRAPQPVINPRPHPPTGTVLFVGNDFERKGGPELLAVFERNLLPHCRLTIVSNSPALRTARVPSNVDIIAGVHDPLQLAQVYRASDLLVLPTKHDCYSHVICEAAAHGVPALATRVGGIGELLDESGGASLRPNCAPEEIASEIRQVLTHGYDWRAQTASQFARDKLTLELFERLVARALSHVGVVPLTPAASLVANR